MTTKTTTELCNWDNHLISQYKAGIISRSTYLIEKAKCHKEYVAATSDTKDINDLMRKYGGA